MEIEQHENLEYIGLTASFYVPRSKMTAISSGVCHDFFLKNYDAYTVEDSNIQGYWRRHPESPIFEDRNVKYVVSFHGKDKIKAFIDFLSSLCGYVGEECIYMTIGNESFLVFPKVNDGLPANNI